MRKILLTSATALTLTSAAAFAGGTVEPIMVPEVVTPAPTSTSDGGLLIPLLLLLVLAAAASNA